MTLVIFFIFGMVIGSFLNVVALRYDGEHFLFDPKIIGGRSRCPHCGKQLAWFELVPVASFLFQRGKCRKCGVRIGLQYLAVELISGALFTAIPLRLMNAFSSYDLASSLFTVLWILVFVVLLLIAYIDIRMNLIPDECQIMLGVLAIAILTISATQFGAMNHSFFGIYAWILGLQANIWVAHLVGAVFGFAFFEMLVLVTRGKGMGMGDVKLALPLGFLFGWPDILLLFVSAFVIGAIAGIIGIMLQKKTMKATLPFAPFLTVGAAFVFFFGSMFVGWYVKLLGL